MLLADGGFSASATIHVKPTQDWTEAHLDFINGNRTAMNAYVGLWGGKRGTFWLDDLRLAESDSLADIVRRPGTPLVLTGRDREMTFVEGRDFEPVKNVRRMDAIALTPTTRIREGERLELSCYRTPYIVHNWGRQISLCMSNPRLYEYWEAQARKLHEIVPYTKFLLAMDEIRNGGGCAACRASGKSMARILGDCVTKQRDIFRKIDPGIEVLIWSDMLDPAHNARNGYYGVVGDFTGSWKYVPKDLTIMCWYLRICDKSLPFFSEHGFATMGAAYYDAADLAGCRRWLDVLRRTPGAKGIMYTTWEKKYDLLAAFGDLVSGKD